MLKMEVKMLPKSSLLRAAARSVLVDQGFEVRVDPGQGYLPGSRVVAKKGRKELTVAVKASKERTLSFTRQSDGHWRTLSVVDQVLAVVPTAADADDFEVMVFQPDKLIAAFDRAWKGLKKEKHPVSSRIPVFIPLDEVVRKNVGHDVSNLKALASRTFPLTPEQIQASSLAESEENYLDAFIRRYAKDHGVEEHRVIIAISGRRK
jgi:hypothetical protein